MGAIRILRRYVTAAVVIVLAYLFIQLLRHPLPPFTQGTWGSGFWVAVDTVVAAAISFAPLAADYTRHSRSQAAAFNGTFFGYGTTQVLCYVIGLLALVTVARSGNIYGAFIALPAGAIGFGILALRELDQSFANVYSTAASTQNLRPLWDRRVLAIVISAVTTAGALLPWAAGFVTYQLINPGYISWWVSAWTRIAQAIGFTPAVWMSASICSFVVAAVVTLLVGGLTSAVRIHRRGAARGEHDAAAA